jgi:methylthioribose-1-phosphate isomerase
MIPIEERASQEVRGVMGSFGEIRWSPASAHVYNPSFDVTPVDLIAALVLDKGVITQTELKKQNGLKNFITKGI